ncbi:dTDP-glucose 4,6-dehydratase [Candidatus Saccharibacteria bacterium]|nr:dTDP-glucose 4,6-dehydratase [Candidatus Saccharibacteria bacterium]
MKILVTGGAGFIGSNFVLYMRNKYPEYEITVVDALTYAGDRDRLKSVESKIKFHKADISDTAAMDQLVAGHEWITHFAAHSHVDRSIADPGPFLQSNVIGTDVLARAALKHGVKKFHHVSTDEVFGSLQLGSSEKFNEQTPYDPRSPYSASKAASDHLVRAYGETYGLPYTITNCSNNYGPYDSPGRVIPVFIARALEDKPLPVYGKGQAVRDYLFVEDHCRAIDLAMHKGEVGETYCVGGGAQRNGIQVAETILEVLGKPKSLVEFVKDRPGHDMRYDIDSSHIHQKLGWQPSVSFEEGMSRTVEWYKNNLDWLKAFEQRMDLMRGEGLYNTKDKK